MKTQKKLIALSLTVAAILFSGCSSDDESSAPAPTYSNTAVKSFVSYGYDSTTASKYVEFNETMVYDGDNRLSERHSLDYDYSNRYYDHDDNITTKNTYITYYKVTNEDCQITTDENGRKLTEVCDEVQKISIDGDAEKTWRELSEHEQSAFSLDNKERNEKTFTYNENGFLVEETNKLTRWNKDANQTKKYINNSTVYGDTNSSVPDYELSKTTYIYDTFSPNENGDDKIHQAIMTSYVDIGRLDSDFNVIKTWDGVLEQIEVISLAFNYNDNDKISTLSEDSSYNEIYDGSDGNKYKSSLRHRDVEISYFYDDSQRVTYINDDPSDLEDATTEVLYNNEGRAESFTSVITDFNNPKLNELKVHDSMFSVTYDGNKVSQLLFMNGSYIDITYDNFDNQVYGFSPLDWFLRTEPDAEGRTIYTGTFF